MDATFVSASVVLAIYQKMLHNVNAIKNIDRKCHKHGVCSTAALLWRVKRGRGKDDVQNMFPVWF